jgi:hypothetical protein
MSSLKYLHVTCEVATQADVLQSRNGQPWYPPAVNLESDGHIAATVAGLADHERFGFFR